MKRKISPYKKGRRAEKIVAKQLEKYGAKVKLSPGSRSKTDVTAEWSTGRKWLIQVKSGEPPFNLSPEEKKGLKSIARKKNATPVIAIVDDKTKRPKYYSARTGRRLRVKRK